VQHPGSRTSSACRVQEQDETWFEFDGLEQIRLVSRYLFRPADETPQLTMIVSILPCCIFSFSAWI
jgi:hypothetical protein